MIRAVCFDLMGTVLTDPYRDALQAATGLELATIAEVRDPLAWPDFETGAIDEATFVRRFFTDPDAEHRFDIDAFHAARHAGYAFLSGMDVVLDALAGQVERYIASNYPLWIEDLRVRFALDERAEGVWASCHLGVRKPDEAFYHLLAERIGRPPAACLFVDDRLVNCEAAEAVGMRAHHFTDADDLAERLRAEGFQLAHV